MTVSLIEERLKSINEAVFQELCDVYISLRYHNSLSFSRPGSQLGKQKTTVGTPDSFIKLADGTYLFIESTTQQKGLLKKFKGDVSNCLDERKTSIPKSKIREIILCCNSKIDTKLDNKITEFAKPTHVRFITSSELAIQLSLNFRTLAHEYLHLPLDTGQIVTLESFVKHYNSNSQSIATPIDNPLRHREDEMSRLTSLMQQHDVIVVSGSSGAGKTKLAVEAIAGLVKENSYTAFAVLNRNCDLYADLPYYINGQSKNILFIDDANRIDRLSQIAGFIKGFQVGQLKLVLTVRDYALEQVKRTMPDSKVFNLNALTEDEVIDIIKNPPYTITNEIYHPKILTISSGNIRLAIMAARLAIQKQDLNALHEVYDLFDEYFKTFVQDNGLLREKSVLQTLGILAYFNTVALSNTASLDNMISKFSLERTDFVEASKKLEEIEIVEIQNSHIKISDQSISAYFFFKTFFKDDLLPFSVIINDFYETTSNRIRDTIIPANNMFGYSNVREKIRPILLHKLKSLSTDTELIQFFELFWFYLENELLNTVFLKIKPNQELNSGYRVNDGINTADDSYLKLLYNIIRYHHSATLIKQATELTFEYTRSNPSTYSQFVKSTREHFSFDYEDESDAFQKQIILFDLLQENIYSDRFYTRAFFDVVNNFLRFRYQQSKPLIGHKFSLYSYQLKDSVVTQGFRKQLWQSIDELFPSNPNDGFETIHKYTNERIDVNIEMLQNDFLFIDSIVSNHFYSERFDHAFVVQELCGWAKRVNITEHALLKHKLPFFTEKYKLFRKIDWNRLRDKEQHEYKTDSKYETVKEAEIRQSFRFDSIVDFEQFISTFTEILTFKKDRYGMFNSLAIVVDENIDYNPTVALKIFESLVRNKNLSNFTPYLALTSAAMKDEFFSDAVWSIVKPYTTDQVDNRIRALFDWQIHFLLALPQSKTTTEKCDALVSIFQSTTNSCSIALDGIEKYETLYPGITSKIANSISLHNESGTIKIALPHYFFERFSGHIHDLALLKRLYIQQDDIQQLFDYNGDDLTIVLRRDHEFLIEYVDSIAEDNIQKRSADYRCFQVIWEINLPQEVIKRAVNSIIKSDSLGIGNELLGTFFTNVKPDSQSKADRFILDYISEYHSEPIKMNSIFELVAIKMKHIFSQAFSSYLNLNQNIEDFKKINWTGDGIVIHRGSAIIGDIKMAKWQYILELINKEDFGLSSIPFYTWVAEQVEIEKSIAGKYRGWGSTAEW